MATSSNAQDRIQDAEKLLNIQQRLLDIAKEQKLSQNEMNSLVKDLDSLHAKASRTVKKRGETEEKMFHQQQSINKAVTEYTKLLGSPIKNSARIQEILKEIEKRTLNIGKLERQLAEEKLIREQNINKLGLGRGIEMAKEMNSIARSNPMLLIAMAGLIVWKKIFAVFAQMDEAAANFRKEMGVTRTYTKTIDENARSIAFEFANVGVSAEIAFKSVAELGKILGSTSFVTKDIATDVSLMNAQLGIAQETSAKFLQSMGMASRSTASAKSDMLLFAASLSEAAGTSLGDVMGDINNATKSSYSYITRSSLALIKASVEAKRMGTSIDSTVKSSKSLLSFRDSVNREMEASVLLGQSINLQAARELAYRKDLRGLNKEILKIIDDTQFEKLDPFQQEAIAASLGKQASELGEMAQAERQRRDLEKSIDPVIQSQLRAYNAMTTATETRAKEAAKDLQTQLRIKSNASAIASITQSWGAITQQIGAVFLPMIASVLTYVAEKLSTINKFLSENPFAKWVLAAGAVAVGVVAIGVAVMTIVRAFGLLGKLGGGAGGGIAGVFQGVAKGVSAMGSPQVLKGALGIAALGISLFVFGKSLSAFADIKWAGVWIGLGALAAFAVVAGIIGAPPIVGFVLMGSLAIAALGLALIPFAAAAWIASKALQNLSTVKWGAIAGGILSVGIQTPLILGMGLAMAFAAPGIVAFSFALIPLAFVAKKAGDGMMSLGAGFLKVVESLERLQNISLIGTILQVRSLSKAVSELSQVLTAMPDIQVQKLEQIALKSEAISNASKPKDTSMVDELKGIREELLKMREDFSSGKLKASVSMDGQKIDSAVGRRLEFAGTLM